MKGKNEINHRPYIPMNAFERMGRPFICRLVPNKHGFDFEWFDNYSSEEHFLYYSERGRAKKTKILISDSLVSVEGLEYDRDYEFYIESKNGVKSNTRLVRTAEIPQGTAVINYLHPDDAQYDFSGKHLCSPSLVRTKSGRLIAGMDIFQSRGPQNLTVLFYSDDNGKTFRYLTDIYPFYWGNLFTNNGKLYIIGLSTEYGNLQISESPDDGVTWSKPTVLYYGSSVLCSYGGLHRAPMHFTEYKGRLYTSVEYGGWGRGSHLSAVVSVSKDSDLMEAENWSISELLPFEGKWKEDSDSVQGDTIEGNVTVLPDGKLYNLLRYKSGEFLMLKVNTENPDAPAEYAGIVKAPVSSSMFRVFSHNGIFYFVTNRKTEAANQFEARKSYRNVLSLIRTEDFENFTLVEDIINYENMSPALYGFQYPAFIKENNKVSLVIRSSFGGAGSYHDSNYMLFKTFEI